MPSFDNAGSNCQRRVIVEVRLMALLTALFSYLGKFILFIFVAVVGFLAGKTFKRSKAKKSEE